LIFATAKFALSIETPASEYEIDFVIIFENRIINRKTQFSHDQTQKNSNLKSISKYRLIQKSLAFLLFKYFRKLLSLFVVEFN
jgi:UDP-3-O-acyl-N-acetylglucosamine deacetylase